MQSLYTYLLGREPNDEEHGFSKLTFFAFLDYRDIVVGPITRLLICLVRVEGRDPFDQLKMTISQVCFRRSELLERTFERQGLEAGKLLVGVTDLALGDFQVKKGGRHLVASYDEGSPCLRKYIKETACAFQNSGSCKLLENVGLG